MPVAGNYRGTFERTMEGKGLMLVWIVILWLLIVGCGSFLEWSVRNRFGAFVFLSVMGSILAGMFIGGGAVIIEATLELFWGHLWQFS